MSARRNDPPSEPVFTIPVPVRRIGRGVYALKPLVEGGVGAGDDILPMRLAISTETNDLHITFGGVGDPRAGGYVITWQELLQPIADEHQRRLGPRKAE